jgi:hypothetical protein
MSQPANPLPVIPPPDISFEPLKQTGWAEPIFIVKVGADQFFLTKVVWPYDRAHANSLPPGDPRRDSFERIEKLFNAGVKLEAVQVRPMDTDGITFGITD